MSEAAFPRPLSTLVEEEGEEDEAPPLRINFTVASMVEGEAPPTPNSAPPTPKLSLSLRAMLEEDEIEIDMETSPPRKAADGGGADAAVGRKVAVAKPEAEDRAKPARAPRQRGARVRRAGRGGLRPGVGGGPRRPKPVPPTALRRARCGLEP